MNRFFPLPGAATPRLCFSVGLAAILCLAAGSLRGEKTHLRGALESITAGELQRHIDVLADDSFEGREAGSRGGRAAGHYLVELLKKAKLRPAGENRGYYQEFNSGYRNVLALLPGRDPELRNEVIVIGAHYDHVGYGNATNSYGPTGYIHNGADDNASGTSALLEVVEGFSLLPEAPRRSLLFAFWDGEEKGLLGSAHWAAQPTLALEQVQLKINADMVGRLRGDRLLVYGTRTALGLRQLVSRQNEMELLLDFSWEMKENSDHHTFFARRVPVLMFHTDLHDDYHRPRDDAHLINAAGLERVSRLMFLTAHALAEEGVPGGFRSAGRYEGPAAMRELEAPLPPPAPRLGVRWEAETAEGAGLTVSGVTPGSPAARSGVRPGDRLLQFNERELLTGDDLRAEVAISPAAARLRLARADEPEPRQLTLELAGKPVRLGLAWREDPADPGVLVVVQVTPGSPAALAGFLPGDRVYELAGARLNNAAEFRSRLASLEGPVEFLRERRGRLQVLTCTLPPLAAAAE